MYAVTYLEINTFCIVILLIILKCHLENLDKSINARIFRDLLICLIGYGVLDLLCGLYDNDAVFFPRPVIEALNVAFYYVSYLMSYLCLLYAGCELQAKWIEDRKKLVLYGIPTLLMFVLTPLTLKYHFFFYIDEAGNYAKGPLYFPMLLLVYGHLIAIGVKAVVMLSRKRNYVQRAKIITLSSFVVFPLLAGLFQAFFSGISIICMGCTIVAVQVFVNTQKNRITIDPLTQLNNRSKMMLHLERCIDQTRNTPERPLYLLMMDIDGFKQINDQFGHVEGDRALIRLAKVLKKAAAKEKCLIARYGGDEFAVVLESGEGMITGEEFARRIQGLLKLSNESATNPYTLRISIGCARYTPEMRSVQEFVRKADQVLYREKDSRKAKRHG